MRCRRDGGQAGRSPDPAGAARPSAGSALRRTWCGGQRALRKRRPGPVHQAAAAGVACMSPSPTRLQTCAEAAGRVGPGAVAAQCCAAAPGLAHRAARPRTPSQSPGTGPRPTRVSGAPAAAPAPGSPRAPNPPTARARRARGRRPCSAARTAGGRGSARARASCSLRGPSSYTYTLPDLTR